MNADPSHARAQPVLPKWPFYLLDALLLLAAAALVTTGTRPLGAGSALLVVTCGLGGALASILPHWFDLAGTDAPACAPTGNDPAPLAELALLAWRIRQRVDQAPDTHRSIVRNAHRLLDVLKSLGVEIISYAGRKLDAGSRVQILEAVPGEENRVLEESEPEIQIHGRIVRQALVTVGRGHVPPAGEPEQT